MVASRRPVASYFPPRLVRVGHTTVWGGTESPVCVSDGDNDSWMVHGPYRVLDLFVLNDTGKVSTLSPLILEVSGSTLGGRKGVTGVRPRIVGVGTKTVRLYI